MRTVYVNHPGEVMDIQSVFALIVLVLHRQIEYGFQVSNTTL
jgi:hypothetical protein